MIIKFTLKPSTALNICPDSQIQVAGPPSRGLHPQNPPALCFASGGEWTSWGFCLVLIHSATAPVAFVNLQTQETGMFYWHWWCSHCSQWRVWFTDTPSISSLTAWETMESLFWLVSSVLFSFSLVWAPRSGLCQRFFWIRGMMSSFGFSVGLELRRERRTSKRAKISD